MISYKVLSDHLEQSHDTRPILMPRTNSGLGGLAWHDVKPLITTYLEPVPQTIVLFE